MNKDSELGALKTYLGGTETQSIQYTYQLYSQLLKLLSNINLATLPHIHTHLQI